MNDQQMKCKECGSTDSEFYRNKRYKGYRCLSCHHEGVLSRPENDTVRAGEKSWTITTKQSLEF